MDNNVIKMGINTQLKLEYHPELFYKWDLKLGTF